MEPCVADLGLFVHIIHNDLFHEVLGCIENDGRFPLWLTCKAFNAHRPAGIYTTSVRAITTPAMLDWAIGCGLQPHLILQALRRFGPDALTQFGSTIMHMMRIHPDSRVKRDAADTTIILLKKLNVIDDAALLDPLVLTAYTGFIADVIEDGWRSITRGRAMWALRILMYKLGKMEAHVLLACVITETLSDTRESVRSHALRVLYKIEHKVLGQHASAIVHILFKHRYSHRKVCIQVLQILDRLDQETLTEFAYELIEMLPCSFDVCDRALSLLDRFDQNPITAHVDSIKRRLGDPDKKVRYAAVMALSKLEFADLAQHADAIAGRLSDQSLRVRCAAVEAINKLESADHMQNSLQSFVH